MIDSNEYRKHLEGVGRKYLEDLMFSDIESDEKLYHGLSTTDTERICRVLIENGWVKYEQTL